MKSTTKSPTDVPSYSLSTSFPTSVPSDGPSESPPPFIDVDVTDNSFVLGLSLGLAGAFLISAVVLLYYRHLETKAVEERRLASAVSAARKQYPDNNSEHDTRNNNVLRGYDNGDGSADNLDSGVVLKGNVDLTLNEDNVSHGADERNVDCNDNVEEQHHSRDCLDNGVGGVVDVMDDPNNNHTHNHNSGMLQPLSSQKQQQ